MMIRAVTEDLRRAKKQETHECYSLCGTQVSLRRKYCYKCAADKMDEHSRRRVGTPRKRKAETDKA